MNERIKELAEVSSSRYQEHLIDLEKFAELIIRECAVIANETLDPLDDYLIGNDILKHFGVLDE